LSINGIIDAEKWAPYIYDCIWLLFRTSELKPFYTSDNPITFSGGPYSWDSGFPEGVQLYFPVCKTLSLVIFCKSYKEKLHDCALRFKPLMEGLNTGRAIPMHAGTVVHHNMLQVNFSLRFVFSSIDNFNLVREILTENHLLKNVLA
jgi:hypothetical protein